MNNNFEEKLKGLKIAYIAKLKETLPEIEKLTTENSDIQEVYQKIHKLAGTCGMYGLNEISNIATELEIYLKPLKENPTLIKEQELSEKLKRFVTEYRKIIGV
jgi:HPt (histidine-containing phosphotransfer) domain-containing protein